MPTTPRQIDIWRQTPSEYERLEFKEAKAQFDNQTLYKYCVAIANEGGGILLLGIGDKPPRRVVGTGAFSNPAKMAEKAFQALRFRVDIEEVAHPDGRVVVFHIPSRPRGTAYQLGGAYLMRSGESLVAMSEDRLRQIFAEAGPEQPKERHGWLIPLMVAAALCFGALAWFTANKFYERQRQAEGPAKSINRDETTQRPVSPAESLGTKAVGNEKKQGTGERRDSERPSFVYLAPGPWILTGAWDFIVSHRGPDPSYNVEILCVDKVKQEQVLSAGKAFLTPADLDSYQFLRKFAEVDPKGRGSVFATQILWAPPVPDHERYAIEVAWRDGRVHQDLQIERIDDKWFWATQITDLETKKVLVNCKDKGFPYGPAGDKPCFPEMAIPD